MNHIMPPLRRLVAETNFVKSFDVDGYYGNLTNQVLDQLKAYPQGTYGNGKLFGGLRIANNSKGCFYQKGGDAVSDQDNFAIPDVLNRIKLVAREWEKRHPDLIPLKANIFTTGNADNLYADDGRINVDGTPQVNGIRIGMNDLSKQNGGEFQPHNSHQNGGKLIFHVLNTRRTVLLFWMKGDV